MPTAPIYRRGDSVYLKSSAEIGKLESYQINSIKQLQNGQWIYRINIEKKPPNQGLIGDSFDARISEGALFYTEGELITVCEALDIIVDRLTKQVAYLENNISSRCAESDAPVVLEDEPRWSIGDTVYFEASARIGFIHQDIISSIHEVGIQTGSRRTRYCYQVANVKKEIYFYENELITYCEATTKALSVLQKELADSKLRRTKLCLTSI